MLSSCGLRREELVSLEVDKIQQSEGRWVIPDLVGKGNRLRTVTIPAAVKVRIEVWIAAGNEVHARRYQTRYTKLTAA
jgi:site-specific recombinase XerC